MAQSGSQAEAGAGRDRAVSAAAPGTVVLTGDLVGSSRLAPAELAEALRALEAAAADFARVWAAAGWDAGFSSFRGDGWQCLAPAPRLALRAALALRARLGALGRQFDTRVSIATGAGRAAFELSGRGLDTMEHARRFAVAWTDPPPDADLLRAVFALTDEVSRNWTPGQCRVFARLLLERQRPSQTALARDLDITQQAVAAHLAGGGDWALQEALRAVEGAGGGGDGPGGGGPGGGGAANRGAQPEGAG